MEDTSNGVKREWWQIGAIGLFAALLLAPSPVHGQCQPACETQNIECVNPGPQYNNRRFVCQLQRPNGDPYCTGWIVAAPDCILTAAECIPAVGDRCVFNFECTACVGGVPKPTVSFSITQILQCNLNQNWCLVRVAGDAAAQFGQASIDPSVVGSKQDIYLIHHASNLIKGYDEGVVDVLFDPMSAGCPGTIAEHHVNTIPAPGSPVFRMDNHCVCAMSDCGSPCNGGFVLPLSTIWPPILAAVNQAGCIPVLCGQECPPSDHDCFTVGVAGCTDAQCCATVCAVDPFCCEVEWDAMCVEEAFSLCGGCGDSDSGDCCAEHDTPFCNDQECCAAVCAIDPFCCTDQWDGICVAEANILCKLCDLCPTSDHNCFTRGVPGCTDEACCGLVCGVDPFCCDTFWDNICIAEASELCDGCGDPEAGRCDRTHTTPYCAVRACCDQICAIDPFCCSEAWDCLCVQEALEMCGLCTADFDGSEAVDIDDLFGLLGAWETADPLYDVSPPCGNGTIDIDDLFTVIDQWGPC